MKKSCYKILSKDRCWDFAGWFFKRNLHVVIVLNHSVLIIFVLVSQILFKLVHLVFVYFAFLYPTSCICYGLFLLRCINFKCSKPFWPMLIKIIFSMHSRSLLQLYFQKNVIYSLFCIRERYFPPNLNKMHFLNLISDHVSFD